MILSKARETTYLLHKSALKTSKIAHFIEELRPLIEQYKVFQSYFVGIFLNLHQKAPKIKKTIILEKFTFRHLLIIR